MELFLEIGLSNAVVALGLALLAFGAGRMFRRPAVTHGLWLLVLIKLVTPPLAWIPVVNLPAAEAPELADAGAAANEAKAPVAPPSEPETGIDLADDQSSTETKLADNDTLDFESKRASVAAPLSIAPPEPAISAIWREWFLEHWRLVVGGVWLGGALCWLVLAAVRIVAFHRLLRFARPAPADLQDGAQRIALQMGLRRCPEVRLVPGPVSPMLWGLSGRPRLLIPTELLTRLDNRQLAPLLAHELAHYRRGDHWVRWLELVATCMYWWHPVLWLAKKELREAEEQCCDAWAVWAAPNAARSYALALMETVDFLAEFQPAVPALASGLGQVSHLQRRVTMIMKGETPRTLSWAGTVGLLSLAAALVPWLPTWAQPAPPGQRPPGGGEERRDRERPDSERQAQIEEARAAVRQMAEQMRHLQEQMERAQRRLAELEGRSADGRGERGRFGPGDSDRRPGDGAERTRRRDEAMPEGGGRGLPGAGRPPGFGGMPGGAVPGQPGAPGGFGRGPGMPPGMGGGMPDADINRRLEELERKMERIMQMMERSQEQRGRSEPPPRRERGRGGDGERAEPAAEAPRPVRPPTAPGAPADAPSVKPPPVERTAEVPTPPSGPLPERR